MATTLRSWTRHWTDRPNPHDRSRAGKPRRPSFECLEQRLAMAIIGVSPGVNTIQPAVALAKSGDTLSLAAGVYQITDTVLINKDLTIQGASASADQVHIAPT